MTLADLLLLAGLVAFGSALAWIASKVRDHRRLLDRRVDVLAEESRERAQSLGRTLHELADRLEALEREERLNRLTSLVSAAERGGRISTDAARGLDRALEELRHDARAGEE